MEAPQLNGKRLTYINTDRTPQYWDDVLVTVLVWDEDTVELQGKVHEETPGQIVVTQEAIELEDGRMKSIFRGDEVLELTFVKGKVVEM